MRKKFLLTMFSLVLFAFCGTSLNAQVARVNGTEYETLTAAFAAVTNDNQDVVVLKDVTEDLVGAYLRGNITTENGAKVTITLTNSGENYYIYCPYTFILGENVTLKVPSGCLFYYAGGTQINGTLVTNGYYQRYAGTKLTINEPGSMTVTSETCVIRLMDGDANAGIYVNGDNDNSTIGLNLSVAYFYQGVISAKNANIKTAVYWQTNETDNQGSANLVLDNSTLTVYGGELKTIVSGNSTVTLKNGSSLTTNSEFQYGNDTQFVVDATSSIKDKNGEVEVPVVVATVNGVKYATFAEAYGAAQAGDVIKLLADVTVTSKLIIDKAVTIDGNDYSILADANTVWYTVSGKLNTKNYKVYASITADATLKNITFDANSAAGGITVDGANVVLDNFAIKNLMADAVTLNNNANVVVKTRFAVEGCNYTFIDARNGVVTVAEGTLFDMAKFTGNVSPATSDLKGAVDANGNSFFCAYGSTAYYKTLTNTSYSNLTLLADVEFANNVTLSGTLNLNGHNLTVAEGKVLKVSSTLAIAGDGELNAAIALTNLKATLITDRTDIAVTTNVDDTRVVYEDGAYKVVTAYVAQIGTQGYTTLQAAFEAVKDGETITIIDNVTVSVATAAYNDGTYIDGVRYTGDKSFTVDFNGKTVTDDGCVNDYLIYINNKGEKASEITFTNGTIVSNNGCWSAVCVNSSAATQNVVLNLNGMNITNSNDAEYSGNPVVRVRNLATVNVNDKTVITSDGASYGVAANTDGSTLNINEGATIVQQNSGTTGGNSVFAAVGGKGVINIKGGTITSDKFGVHTMTTGTPVINISGGTITAPVALKSSTNGGNGELATINVTGGTINGTLETYTENGKIVVSGGTFSKAVAQEYCAEGYAALQNLDGKYVIGTKPTATIENLGSMVVEAGEYFVKNLQGSGDNSKDMPLQFVMKYTADQSAEDVAESPYKEWYADFVLSFTGLANGKFVADENTYLAGFYGETEKWEGIWAKVGITGMEITEGTRYPVMLGVGMPQNYEYICAGVEEFLCAMNISSEILNANPNLKVTLELCLVDNSNDDAALNALQTGEKCNVAAKEEFTADDFAKVLEGEGTEEKPFLIKNLDDLVLFRNSVNAGETKYNAPGVYVALAADIDMEGIDWSVNIGDDCNATFDGIFDGKNHTISNLTSTETAKKDDGYICTGLFGAIYGDAVVKNFTIEDVTINTGDFTGNNVSAVVGFAYNAKGSVENVTVKGDIKINAPKTTAVGAIVGYAYGSSMTVKDCEVIGNDNSVITGAAYVGGIIGYSTKDALNANTVNNVDINATSCAAGGVAGIMLAGGSAKDNTIENVNLESEHANWKNAAGIVVGSITGTVTISGTTYSDVNTDRIVGSAHADKPTTPVAKVEARIGDVYYTTYAKAYAAANAGETITLLCDAQGAGVVIDKNVTIDFDGYTYTFSELGVGSGTLTSNGFQILNGNDVTLKNGRLNVAEAMKNKYYILIQNYANLDVENMTLDGTNLDKWSLTDGDSYVLSNNSGEVNIINSKIIANDNGALAYAFDVCKDASYEAPIVTLDATSTINGKVELSGGQFYPAQAVTVSMTKAVESYQVADNNEELESGWYTISAPFAVNPALTEGYELFRYNEAEAMWENHKNSEHNSFGLEVGRGYLYAHANGADLNLEGVANIADYTTTLSYTANEGHELEGFHLVGNPYTFSISGEHFSGNVAGGFYTLAGEGAWVVKPTANEITVGEGFLVQATETTAFAINKTATATRSADNGSLQINVANAKYSDVAYVSFNEGVGLSKISHQNTNIPMVYVPVGGENYSIAYMNANVEEIPFAFEAKTMGSYTISVEAQNCEFETMTLVDRFTGIETNLLLEDYSFIAKSGDNSDRFIIRLSNETLNLGDENFVYINNNGLIIDNASSNATLQIFDVMGRPVASYNLSGSANISMESLTNGVYILRLMDENNVRVQKVVID